MNTEKIKVIIADDHDLYRDGLKNLLNSNQETEVIAEASNGEELLQLVKRLSTDVVITDLRMPGLDSIDAIKELHSMGIEKIIALCTYDSEHLIIEALEAGALGYIIRNAQKGEIVEAVKTVNEGIPYYCRSTNKRLISRISKSSFNPYNKTTLDMLTEKDKTIIRLICEEKSSEEIASLTYIGKRTIDGLRSKILEKINAKTTVGLVIFAIKNSIYEIDTDDQLFF